MNPFVFGLNSWVLELRGDQTALTELSVMWRIGRQCVYDVAHAAVLVGRVPPYIAFQDQRSARRQGDVPSDGSQWQEFQSRPVDKPAGLFPHWQLEPFKRNTGCRVLWYRSDSLARRRDLIGRSEQAALQVNTRLGIAAHSVQIGVDNMVADDRFEVCVQEETLAGVVDEADYADGLKSFRARQAHQLRTTP